MTVEQDLQESIRKNMPQAIGAELQTLLAKGTADAAALTTTKNQLESSRAEYRQATSRYENAEALLKKHADLDARLVAIENRERAAEVRDLQLQLAAAKELSASLKEIAMGLVRNTEYRKTVMNTETVPIERAPSYPGQPSYVEHHTKTNSSTATDSAT